ncbi:SEPP1 protein, partial [Amia calva]|nr:SEPP1 protein [Amia calva]
MWTGLGLVLALALLPVGRAEREAGGSRCKEAPPWTIGSQSPMSDSVGQVTVVAMDDLRMKLEGQGLVNISYMVVNNQGEDSRRLFRLLRMKASKNIIVYDQYPLQEDVWRLLSGEKDDFLIYDRCGRLTAHLGLPYSVLSFPYVEEAIRDAYCKGDCGQCSHENSLNLSVCNSTVTAGEKPEGKPEGPAEGQQPEETVEGHNIHPGHGHGHHHHHGEGRHHGHHGDSDQQLSNDHTQRRSQTILSQQEVVDFPFPIGRP